MGNTEEAKSACAATLRRFWSHGEPMVWATAAALALMLLMTVTLLLVVMVNGLGVFWPSPLEEVTLADGAQAPRPADHQPDQSGQRRPQLPVQDGQSRARPPATGFPLDRRGYHPPGRVSSRRHGVGTRRERRLLRLPQGPPDADAGSASRAATGRTLSRGAGRRRPATRRCPGAAGRGAFDLQRPTPGDPPCDDEARLPEESALADGARPT